MKLVDKLKDNAIHTANIVGSFIPGVNNFTNPWTSVLYKGTDVAKVPALTRLKYNKKTNIVKSLAFLYTLMDFGIGIYSMTNGDNSDYVTGLKQALYQGIESGWDLAMLTQMTIDLKDSFGIASYYEVPRTIAQHTKDAWKTVKKGTSYVWNNKVKTLSLAALIGISSLTLDHYTGALKYPIGGLLSMTTIGEDVTARGILSERDTKQSTIEDVLEGNSLTKSFNESVFSSTNPIDNLLQRANEVEQERGIVIYDRSGKEIGHIKAGAKWQKLDYFPKKLQEIIQYQEDRNFMRHGGFNWTSQARAVYKTFLTIALGQDKNWEGGSGISQQVASFLYPEPKGKLQKLWYKALEMGTTYQVEFEFNKEEILETYMNSCPFNGTIRGYADATRHYFNRNPDNLELHQMVMLSVIPKGTGAQPYTKNGRKVLRKRAKNLTNLMVRENYITKTQANEIIRDLFKGVEPYPTRVKADASLMNVIAKDINQTLLDRGLDEGNLKLVNIFRDYSIVRQLPTEIHTSIDKEFQDILDREVKKNPYLKGQNYSYVIIDANNGDIVAIKSNEGLCGSPSVGLKQPFASTIKPFVYSLALEEGLLKPNQTLTDEMDKVGRWEKKWFKNNEGKLVPKIVFTKEKENDYKVGNHNNEFYGELPWQDQLKHSNNIIPVDFLYQLEKDFSLLGKKTGPKQLEYFLQKSGLKITEIKDNQYSAALGTMEISVLDLANLYTAFNKGSVVNNYSYAGRIIDSMKVGTKKTDFEDKYKLKKLIEEQTAEQIKDAIGDKNYQSIDKTGTTGGKHNKTRKMTMFEGKDGNTYVMSCYSTARKKAYASNVHRDVTRQIVKNFAKRRK